MSMREQPAYRPVRPGGMDPTTRRLAIIAGAIAAVLLVVVGGWRLSGHHAGGVPLIAPMPGPLKVKPANPGGLQVLGADPPPASAGAGSETLAPAPEQADPQALAAALAHANGTAPSAPAAGSAAPAPASMSMSAGGATAARDASPASPAASPRGAGAAASPAPGAVDAAPDGPAGSRADAPATAPSAASASAATAPAATPSAATSASETGAPAAGQAVVPPVGRVAVQLAALDTEAAARAEWHRLATRTPALFAGRTPAIMSVDHGGHTLWRLRTGGFPTVAAATAFCDGVRARGGACTVAAF